MVRDGIMSFKYKDNFSSVNKNISKLWHENYGHVFVMFYLQSVFVSLLFLNFWLLFCHYDFWS